LKTPQQQADQAVHRAGSGLMRAHAGHYTAPLLQREPAQAAK
jgi:hypothetical protein